MAKNKIQRIDLEIPKTREKIAEQQEKLKGFGSAENRGGEPGDRPDGTRPAYDPEPAFRHAVRRHGARSDGGSPDSEQEDMTHEE